MANNEQRGSETLGTSEEKSKLTLFKDDRAEDWGAIMVSILIVAYVMVTTTGKSPAPAAPATPPPAVTAPAAPAAAPAAPGAAAAPATNAAAPAAAPAASPAPAAPAK